MSSGRPMPTGTVTMLFTDIVGSTRLLKQLGEHYGELLADHRRLLREAVEARGGREMDNQGDAFFFAFARARDAVEAGVAAQRALAAHEWPDGVHCRVRMGLHTGEPNVGDEGYHGIGLHRGARIAAAAHGGQVLLSNATAELVHDDLPAGIGLKDLGPQQLKDIERPERVYQLVVDGLPSEFPPLRTAAPPPAGRRGRAVAVAGGAILLAVAAAAFLLTRGDANRASAAPVDVDSVGVFTAAHGRLTGQIGVGSSPNAVAEGDASVWVANVDAGSVSRVDPVKQVTIQTITVGNGPAAVAFGGGFVWVANGLDGTVTKIDPRTNTIVDTIHVGNGPAGVAVGRRYVWVANANDQTVTRIDLRSDAARPAISLGLGADGIAVGDGSVWVTSQSAGRVTRIDERTGRVVETVGAGSGAQAVAAASGAVWVANRLDGTVTHIDPDTNDVRATVQVGHGPNGIAAAGDAVWVSNELGGTLSQIDPEHDTVLQTVVTGNRPEGVALSDGQMFVAVRASGAGHRGGTLTMAGLGDELSSFDPTLTDDPSDWQMLAVTNDGLIGFRRVGGSQGAQLVNDLATSLPTPTENGTSYTFRLGRGIRYSTGAPVEPQDIRRGIERSIANAALGGGATYYRGIIGAGACTRRRCDLSRGIVVDPRTRAITFHLVARDEDFLYKLALPYAYAVPAGTPIKVHAPLPATGPYRIASYDAKLGYRLVRNRFFREWSPAAQPNGYPNVIVRRLGGTAADHVHAVLAGRVDVADDAEQIPPSLLERLKTQHASRLGFQPITGTLYVLLNPTLPPFDDQRVRQALNLAVDRSRLAALTTPGALTCQPLPPNFQAYRRYCPYTLDPKASGEWNGPDLARARSLVKASGTSGDPVTVVIPTFWPFGRAAADYLVSALGSLGYRARYGGKVDYNKLSAKRTQVQAGFSGWSADYFSPTGFFANILTCAAYRRGGSNGAPIAGFCDPALDREMARAKALQTTDPELATDLWTKVDHDLVDEAPWVPFENPGFYVLLSERAGNYVYHPEWGVLIDQLWVR